MTRPPAKPRGRPRNPEPYSRVTSWMPARLHDRLIQVAKAHDQSVSATVRILLSRRTT